MQVQAGCDSVRNLENQISHGFGGMCVFHSLTYPLATSEREPNEVLRMRLKCVYVGSRALHRFKKYVCCDADHNWLKAARIPSHLNDGPHTDSAADDDDVYFALEPVFSADRGILTDIRYSSLRFVRTNKSS